MIPIESVLARIWPHIAAGLTLFVSMAATAHVVLYKRDTRSAVGWVGLIWLAPVLGAVLYVLLGINRIRRKARALKGELAGMLSAPPSIAEARAVPAEHLGGEYEYLGALDSLVEKILGHPLVGGNRVEPFMDGDSAYPSMLDAIEQAERTVALQSYIFDNDHAGGMFLHALRKAVERGVDVRVIVDAVGARYSLPPITRKLRKAGVRMARFLPTLMPWRMPFMNLRNHRKILVVDGRTGFTGGMNIREGLLLESEPRRPLRDMHFRLEGPVVAHLQETFASDWLFCTGQRLEGEGWFPRPVPVGGALARGIPDGPDEDFEKLPWTMHGALAVARRSICIMTPYFLPDSAMITALNTAAMRGVRVDIIMPSVNNLPFVKWAATHQLWQVLEHGCRAWMTPPPFDHSKLMLVDGVWVLFGSGNWDARSFLLNFEFNVECYDPALARRLEEYVASRIAGAKEVTLEDVNSRSLPVKLRDGLSRLFSPYL
jgi:cardiolipin synthase